MEANVIQLIVLLAPYGTQIILALIDALKELLAAGHEAPSLAAVTAAIIMGIDQAHPGWTDEERARCAKDAIAVYAARLKATAGAP